MGSDPNQAGSERRPSETHLMGVISDTHGLMRPAALAALAGCEQILHAGDVGKPEVLEALREIAPVIAVRGNVDHGDWAETLPFSAVANVGGFYVYMLHDLNQLDLDPAAGGFSAVISGHSHRAAIRRAEGVLYLNPGSAGARRFGLPVTLACLRAGPDGLDAEIVPLED